MAKQSDRFTLDADDPRVGTLTSTGAVATFPKQFINGVAFHRRHPHSIRRIGSKHCIAFPPGVPQEGNYKIKPAKSGGSTSSAPSSTSPSTPSRSATNKDGSS